MFARTETSHNKYDELYVYIENCKWCLMVRLFDNRVIYFRNNLGKVQSISCMEFYQLLNIELEQHWFVEFENRIENFIKFGN